MNTCPSCHTPTNSTLPDAVIAGMVMAILVQGDVARCAAPMCDRHKLSLVMMTLEALAMAERMAETLARDAGPLSVTEREAAKKVVDAMLEKLKVPR